MVTEFFSSVFMAYTLLSVTASEPEALDGKPRFIHLDGPYVKGGLPCQLVALEG